MTGVHALDPREISGNSRENKGRRLAERAYRYGTIVPTAPTQINWRHKRETDCDIAK
jgi:hypothetical protein